MKKFDKLYNSVISESRRLTKAEQAKLKAKMEAEERAEDERLMNGRYKNAFSQDLYKMGFKPLWDPFGMSFKEELPDGDSEYAIVTLWDAKIRVKIQAFDLSISAPMKKYVGMNEGGTMTMTDLWTSAADYFNSNEEALKKKFIGYSEIEKLNENGIPIWKKEYEIGKVLLAKLIEKAKAIDSENGR